MGISNSNAASKVPLSRCCQVESGSEDDCFCSERRLRPMTRLLLKAAHALCVPAWVFELALEGHSFLSRTRLLLRLQTVPINCLGPDYGIDSAGRVVPCSRTRGRIADIRKFQRTVYLSPADLDIYLAGWNAGAKWADGNEHSCTQDKDSGLLTCMEPPHVTRVMRRGY